MRFAPEKLSIPDQRMKPFIDPDEIWALINNTKPDKNRVRDVISKSLAKQRLTLAETAVLINASGTELIDEIKEGAKTLKKIVYGNRLYSLHLFMWETDALITVSIAVSEHQTKVPCGKPCLMKR